MAGKDMSFKAIEKLYEVTVHDKFKKHKLTQAHVKLTAFSLMNVLLATQTMSNSVGTCLQDHMND